jgi:hypothetical protein
MSNFCKKCGKEIPQTSKYNVCDDCQNKKNGKIRKVFQVVGSTVLTVGSFALVIVAKGKIRGPKS